MVSERLRDVFPGWWRDLQQHPDDYYTVLTNDMDSLLACRVIKSQTGVKIGGYYDFHKGIYQTDYAVDKEPIFVDASIMQDGVKAFDNHFCYNPNKAIINPNLALADDAPYNLKYPGSTLALVAALYDVPITSDKQRDALLAIDGFYSGYYNDNGRWQQINIDWLDELGLSEQLLPTLKAKDKEYFEAYIGKNKFDKPLEFNAASGRFFGRTCVPSGQFRIQQKVRCYYGPPDMLKCAINGGCKEIFSAAFTAKNACVYSYIIDD